MVWVYVTMPDTTSGPAATGAPATGKQRTLTLPGRYLQLSFTVLIRPAQIRLRERVVPDVAEATATTESAAISDSL